MRKFPTEYAWNEGMLGWRLKEIVRYLVPRSASRAMQSPGRTP